MLWSWEHDRHYFGKILEAFIGGGCLIYVCTSIIGGFDNLRPPMVPAEDGVRWICFTDLPFQPPVPPWEFRPAVDVGHPARTSRVPKILPHLMLPPDADYSIWHDANFRLYIPPRQIIGELLRFDDWCAHRHPARDCIYDEAAILLKEGIGTREAVESQIARYRAAHYPAHNGLWANGLIVRRHTPEVAALNEHWWELFAAGCERDQISFPVAKQQCPVRFNNGLLNNIFQSPYMKFNWHAAWRDKEDNPSYWTERDRLREQAAKLEAVTGARCPFPIY